ncbi:MAG: 50S ribosomal protein L18 [Bacteroidota bacterium]
MNKKALRRIRIKKRIRSKISGNTARPRLVVFRSNSEIYAQLVDDSTGKTIVAASSLGKSVIKELSGKNKTEQAKVIGSEIAKKSIGKGISNVVFDRGGYLYHGRVKALADAARESGLKF